MSSFLCFICHNAVNSHTEDVTREKYREVVGMSLCPDSHMCYICSHMVNKLWLFKSVCLKRSLEYPVLFSEKCTINLHRSNIENYTLCCEDPCLPNHALSYRYNENRDSNDYVELEDEHNEEYIPAEHNYMNDEPYCVEEYPLLENVEKVIEGGEFNDDSIDRDESVVMENDDEELVDNCDVIGEELEQQKDTPKSKEDDFSKITLSIDQQKAELEAQRRSKKYIEAEFKCYNCALGFLFKDSHRAHMMRHEESNGEHVCVLCTLRFASTAVLRAHSTGHSERYTCTRCGTRVRKRQRHTHARNCHERERDSAACHLCGNVFQDASGLQQHLKRFHSSKTSSRSYVCNVCGNSYSNQAAVRTHMIKHIQRKFTCDQCPASFSSPYTLTQHKKKHTGAVTSHVCTTCGLSYSSRKCLLAHMRTAVVHQQRVYECPICNRVCPTSPSLTAHISRVHSSTKEFSCHLCPRKYTSRKSLLRHVREHNTTRADKNAQCHLCGKNFKSNSKLNRHIREVCGKDKLEEELAAYSEQLQHEQQNTIL